VCRDLGLDIGHTCVLYHWHPWFAMRVAIHEAVDKADGVLFRCTLSGSTADRSNIQAGTSSQARCLDPPRLAASPFISMDAHGEQFSEDRQFDHFDLYAPLPLFGIFFTPC
jgi:hypothetical protein